MRNRINKRPLAKLIESELDKSETILAVKDMGDKIQSMLENVAKMRVDTLMPLTEKIKEQFSQEEGQRFQQEMDASLNSLQEATTTAKSEVDDQVAILNGDKPAMGLDQGMGGQSDSMDMGQPQMDDNLDDMFGADDSMAGGQAPLGRMRKESVQKMTRQLKILEAKLRKVRK